MKRFTYFLSIICCFEYAVATLKDCSKVKNKTLQFCSTGKELFPVTLKTELYLKEIVEINPEKNSITVRVNMWTYWIDKGLGLSNDTVE